jgi:hypothetical protein
MAAAETSACCLKLFIALRGGCIEQIPGKYVKQQEETLL